MMLGVPGQVGRDAQGVQAGGGSQIMWGVCPSFGYRSLAGEGRVQGMTPGFPTSSGCGT